MELANLMYSELYEELTEVTAQVIRRHSLLGPDGARSLAKELIGQDYVDEVLGRLTGEAERVLTSIDLERS